MIGGTVFAGLQSVGANNHIQKLLILFITMMHKMPELLYAKDALAPYISQETIEYHYGKHLQAYVDNLNKLIPGTEFENASLEDIIRKAEGPIFNNAAQVWNHTFYFNSFAPNATHKPAGKLAQAIESQWGSFEEFKAEFEKKATGLFGSGWTWLVADKDGRLDIVNESNAGNPLRNGLKPLMTIDVWEHAYYIDFRNKRLDSVKAAWNILDWTKIESRY